MRKISTNFLIVFSLLFFSLQVYSQTDCGNNAGFELGNTTGWTCKSGTYGATVWSGICPVTGAGICPTFPTTLGTPGCLNSGGNNAPINTFNDRHTIMTMAYSAGGPLGYDSISNWTVPVVAPAGGNFSFRLGDGVPGGVGTNPNRLARAEAIRLTFAVTAANAGFTYRYAVFLQDPGHLPEEQPRFEVFVTQPDSNDQQIPCGHYKFVAGSSNPYCSGTRDSSTFKYGGHGGNTNWRYTDWTDVGLDLSGYIGQNISVEFRTSDCFPQQSVVYSVAGATTTCTNGVCCWSLPTAGCSTVGTCTNAPGTHSAYAYIEGYCSPAGTTPLPVCTGADSVQIWAPKGYKEWLWVCTGDTTEYTWLHFPKPGDSCVVIMKSQAGCPTKSTVKLTGTDVLTRDTAFCAGVGGNVNLTATLTVPGTYTYAWTGPPLGNVISTNLTTSIAIPNTTSTYTISVTDPSAGCVYKKTMTVTVDPKPVVSISPPTTICSGGSTILTSDGGSPGLNYSWYASTALVSTTSSFSVSPTSNTTYKVVISNSAGCKDSATVLITVDPAVGLQLSPNAAVCAGACTQLTASGAPNITWQPGGVVGTSLNACPGVTTTYTVTGTGGTCTDVKTVTVTTNSIPPVNISPSTAICIGTNTQLSSSGPGCVWNPGGTLNNSGICNPVATPIATTTYTVVVTDGNNCTNSGTTTITVNPITPIAASAQPPSICIGSTTTLSATGGMAQYSWSPGPTPSGSQTPTVTPSSIGIKTYTVGVLDMNGCPNVTTVNVTVNDLPIPTAAPNANICINNSVQLTATGGGNTTGPYTYLWNPGTGLTNTNKDTTTASPPASQTYTVIVTDGNGCTGTATTSVNITQYLSVNVTPDSAICIGGQIQLTSSSPGATDYLWSTGATTNSITVSPTIQTTYTISASNPSGCNGSATVTVDVNPLPVPVAAAQPSSICIGASTTLSVTGGMTFYSWSPGPSPTGSQTPTVTPSSTGITTYTVGVVDPNGCANITAVSVTVNDLPIPTAAPNTSVCKYSPVQLTATGGGNTTGPYTYLWNPGVGLTNSNQDTTTAVAVDTTTYTVTVTDGNGCIGTAMTTVNPIPYLVVQATPNSDICIGDQITLTSNSVGATNYLWDSGIMSSTQTVSPTLTTTYTVYASNPSGCNGDTTVTVTVNPLPIVVISPPTVYCIGGSTQLSADGGGVGDTYAWLPTDANPPTSATPTASPTKTTTYTVTVTTAKGCKDTASTTVTVNPLPVVSVSTDPTLCAGDSTTLTAHGGQTYVWTPGTGLTNPNDSVTVAQPQQTTPYTVTVTDVNNCTNTGQVTVNVLTAPVACDITADICIGQSTPLDATSCPTSNGLLFSWYPDSTLNPQNVPDPIATPFATTTYTVVVWTGLNCPPDTGTALVTVHPIPSITVSPDTTILAGVSVQLTSNYSGNTPDWSPGTWLNCVSCANPLATPWLSTTYIVTTVDSNGCRNADTVTIFVDDILTLYVPSAFTPITYSSTNNVFYAYGVGIWEFEFYVFDRWGALVFQTNDPNIGWDGTYKGKMVPSDVYVWLAKAKSITGKSITKTGPVTVVR